MAVIAKSRPGRPLRGEAKRVRLSFTLPPHQGNWLQSKASRLKISKSELLEKIIQNVQTKSPKVVSLPLPMNKIQAFCQKHHIKKFLLFGSVLRKDFRADSDIDILVEFEKDHKPSLFQFTVMEQELSKILGRKVDLKTPQELSPSFRDEVLAEAEVLFAA